MKLAVFRAETDGRRTARRLAERGHEAVLAPVITVEATGASIDVEQVDAVVLTSQHALPALQISGNERLLELPCFCVGARTAAAAQAIGFRNLQEEAGDATSLAKRIELRLPRSARIAFVAGRDRKPVLEETLRRHGFTVSVTEVYAARPAPAWSTEETDALASCEGALHYSQRSARLAFEHVSYAGLGGSLQEWTHYCLSPVIAEWVAAHSATRVLAAKEATEHSLFALLP